MRGTEAIRGFDRRRSMLFSVIRFSVIMALTAILLYGHFNRKTLFLLVLGPIYTLCMDEGRARERRRLMEESDCPQVGEDEQA